MKEPEELAAIRTSDSLQTVTRSTSDFTLDIFQAGTMMIPSVIAPPALYPGLYRPAAALPLQHTLPSVFPTHSSFLVEDLLRISRPATFINRTVPSTSASLPTATNTVSFSGANAMTHESCSPKTSLSSSKDPTFLKFGVSAILAPSPKSGEFPLVLLSLNSPI